MRLFLSFLFACNIIYDVYSEYMLVDDYNATTFTDMFDFYTDPDPVHGFVNFVDYKTAVREGLFKIMPNNSVYIGVDSTNKSAKTGRNSVRLHSKKRYNHGLFIIDFAKMPANVCGTWQFLRFIGWGRPWPKSGEIHVIEGVHRSAYSTLTLHTENNCYISNSSKNFAGRLESSNCKVNGPPNEFYKGCEIKIDRPNSYAGGGIYAIEWTSFFIQIWHFSRFNIPENMKNNHPDPRKWSRSLAKYSGNCNFDEELHDQTLILAITFCGFLGDATWLDQCSNEGTSCSDYVRDNPHAFNKSYWLINSLKMYVDQPRPADPKQMTVNQPQFSILKLSKSSIGAYFTFIPALLLIVIFCLFLWCYCKRKRQLRKAAICEMAKRKEFNKNAAYKRSNNDDDPWKIKRENLIIRREGKIGAGAFCEVYAAQLIESSGIKRVYKDVRPLSKFCNCDVAVKVLPPFASETEKSDFQEEIAFMKTLKYHLHVVTFLGYVNSNTISPLLVLEYCANGDLLQFLRSNKEKFGSQQTLTVKTLISFARQIAVGLDYFTGLGFIHRDVAARNVLLDKDNISDFGLCRLMDNEIYVSRGGKLPIKWMSIESLKSSEFSAKSDVWSFGVLLYELFSLGESPFSAIRNSDILTHLESGNRLEKPVYCTDEIYNLMLNCWQTNSTDRPDFNQISQLLATQLELITYNYGYVDAIQPSSSFVSETDDDESIV